MAVAKSLDRTRFLYTESTESGLCTSHEEQDCLCIRHFQVDI